MTHNNEYDGLSQCNNGTEFIFCLLKFKLLEKTISTIINFERSCLLISKLVNFILTGKTGL